MGRVTRSRAFTTRLAHAGKASWYAYYCSSPRALARLLKIDFFTLVEAESIWLSCAARGAPATWSEARQTSSEAVQHGVNRGCLRLLCRAAGHDCGHKRDCWREQCKR